MDFPNYAKNNRKCYFPSNQTKEAGIKTLVALDDQGGKKLHTFVNDLRHFP